MYVHFRALKDVNMGPTALRSLTFANLLIRVCVCVCVLCHKHFKFICSVKDLDLGVYCCGPSWNQISFICHRWLPGTPRVYKHQLAQWDPLGGTWSFYCQQTRTGRLLAFAQTSSQPMEDQYFSKNNINIILIYFGAFSKISNQD